jgi:DNA-binding PadR family transcriptional regulator
MFCNLEHIEAIPMKLLSRSEEFVLLCVWKLQERAYSLPIREKISEVTGYSWSLGSIYTPLERLTKKGLLTSYLTEATPERGGRHKRVYQLTNAGRKALLHIRTLEQAMWQDVTGLALEG